MIIFATKSIFFLIFLFAKFTKFLYNICMVDITKQLNSIYELYTQKKYSEAFVLVEEILKIEPQNIYAKRYESLIRPYLNDKSEVGKISTVKWKSLKCSHCQSAISMSALNEEQKTKIRDNDYSNLSIKCPYCHTTFTLQKKTKVSIVGIKIGDKIFYKNKNYRAVGYVNYVWRWEEDGYVGVLEYLEWILLGDDNSYLYFSEGYFIDDGERTYEFEFSEKIIPNFDIEIANENVYIKNIKYTKEINRVKATELYGENSKVFTVGESVELYGFSYGWANYVVEKESAWRQSEAWIYKTWSVSQKQACEIFGKEYKKITSNYKVDIKWYNLFIFASFWFVILLNSWVSLYFLLWLSFLLTWLVLFFVKLKNWTLTNLSSIWFSILFFGPSFAFVFSLVANFFIENRQSIDLQNIDEWKKFTIEFFDPSLITTTETRKQTYDYGGTRTYYEQTTGLQFSIKNENDKKIIEKIKKWNTGNEKLDLIFSQNIYKYR